MLATITNKRKNLTRLVAPLILGKKGKRSVERKRYKAARKRKSETKKYASKGEWKMRPCLGPDCEKWFMTTPDTRLCPSCKARVNDMTDMAGFFLDAPSGKAKKDE